MTCRWALWWIALGVSWWPAWGLTVWAEAPWPLAVNQGKCEVVLPTEHDEQYYLILGTLGHNGPYRVEVRTSPTTDPVAIVHDQPVRDPGWESRVQHLADRQAHARQTQANQPSYPPLSSPPPQKIFHLFVHHQDYHNPSNYVAVTADLQAVGKYCQVYVDHEHADLAGLQPTIADAIRTFDEEVYPRSRLLQGRALDVDRDGRFTLLFSGWLAKLQSGKVSLSGFVRGSDFYREVRAPFSNHCDMLYLNTDLKPGAYLHTILAHEYTHAVLFSEHVFGEYLVGPARRDEESWLDEGLAHLAEAMHGYSWANLDYRLSGFLNAPDQHALVVPDYYGSGLWRTPGNRGSVFLFLHWCQEHFGHEDFAARLIQSNLQGIANLEAATQRPFAELFRDWTTALVTGENGFNVYRRLGSRLLCGPRFQPLTLAEHSYSFQVASTAAAYALLHSPGAAHTRLTVTADPAAQLQVTLLRLPRQTPRLSLRAERLSDTNQVRLVVLAHGGSVRLCDAAWERLSPVGEAGSDTSVREGTTVAQTIQAWFGDALVLAGEMRQSTVLSLPSKVDPAEIVFRVCGCDEAGRSVAAWAVVESEKH